MAVAAGCGAWRAAGWAGIDMNVDSTCIPPDSKRRGWLWMGAQAPRQDGMMGWLPQLGTMPSVMSDGQPVSA